ncbi:hypothetical protein [Desulfonatronum sp. SC1]|uniref:hypothetical protein n=1 Tax=Desulfonatronum sp. SC1 TaxID=2109626 RepID=UPI0018EEA160|nr:hypothetical protein [Desulfonatronum sp. SC1]
MADMLDYYDAWLACLVVFEKVKQISGRNRQWCETKAQGRQFMRQKQGRNRKSLGAYTNQVYVKINVISLFGLGL